MQAHTAQRQSKLTPIECILYWNRIYRAYNLGIAHEAPLPGHTKSVFAENLESAPGSQPAPAVLVAAQPQFA